MPPPVRVEELGDKESVAMGYGSKPNFAEPVTELFATLWAVMTTSFHSDRLEGAVYTPVLETVPIDGLIDQVTGIPLVTEKVTDCPA